MHTESESHDTPQEQDPDAECIVCGNMFCSFGPAPICCECTSAQYRALQAAAPLTGDEATFVHLSVDGFDYWGRNYCAYWAAALPIDNGWLVFEHNEQGMSVSTQNDANAAYAKGTPLPKGWHVFDVATARKAYAIGVGRKGNKWFEKADAPEVDICIQLALLGEVRYG